MSLACLVVGILFAGVAIDVGIWWAAFPSSFFFLASFAIAAAAFTRTDLSQSDDDALGIDDTHTKQPQRDKPTLAILILLICIYSWMLTAAMHLFDAFFKNGPGSFKYYLTLGIAIASSVFVQVYGKRVVREHFGRQGGVNLELNPRQAALVTALVVGFGIYLTWVVS